MPAKRKTLLQPSPSASSCLSETTFLALAQEVDRRAELNDFGKGAVVMVVLLARMQEAGTTPAGITEHLRKIQNAAQQIAEQLPMICEGARLAISEPIVMARGLLN